MHPCQQRWNPNGNILITNTKSLSLACLLWEDFWYFFNAILYSRYLLWFNWTKIEIENICFKNELLIKLLPKQLTNIPQYCYLKIWKFILKSKCTILLLKNEGKNYSGLIMSWGCPPSSGRLLLLCAQHSRMFSCI